jgi:hypothetical protein
MVLGPERLMDFAVTPRRASPAGSTGVGIQEPEIGCVPIGHNRNKPSFLALLDLRRAGQPPNDAPRVRRMAWSWSQRFGKTMNPLAASSAAVR